MTQLFVYDKSSSKHTGRSLLQVEFCLEEKPSTSTEPEATLGHRTDVRKLGQPEEPCALKERQAKVFLVSSLMKEVSKSPNKSTMINDLMKTHFQKMQEKVECYPVSHRDAESHAKR